MTRNEAWHDAKIRVLAVNHDKESEDTVEALNKTFEEVRIEAEPEIVASADIDTLVDHSADSALAFLPFRLKSNQLLGPFDSQPDDLIPYVRRSDERCSITQ